MGPSPTAVASFPSSSSVTSSMSGGHQHQQPFPYYHHDAAFQLPQQILADGHPVFRDLRVQVEFYFSEANLASDRYLQDLLLQGHHNGGSAAFDDDEDNADDEDHDGGRHYMNGAVHVGVIATFNKVKEIYASAVAGFAVPAAAAAAARPDVLLTALRESTVVEVSRDCLWFRPMRRKNSSNPHQQSMQALDASMQEQQYHQITPTNDTTTKHQQRKGSHNNIAADDEVKLRSQQLEDQDNATERTEDEEATASPTISPTSFDTGATMNESSQQQQQSNQSQQQFQHHHPDHHQMRGNHHERSPSLSSLGSPKPVIAGVGLPVAHHPAAPPYHHPSFYHHPGQQQHYRPQPHSAFLSPQPSLTNASSQRRGSFSSTSSAGGGGGGAPAYHQHHQSTPYPHHSVPPPTPLPPHHQRQRSFTSSPQVGNLSPRKHLAPSGHYHHHQPQHSYPHHMVSPGNRSPSPTIAVYHPPSFHSYPGAPPAHAPAGVVAIGHHPFVMQQQQPHAEQGGYNDHAFVSPQGRTPSSGEVSSMTTTPPSTADSQPHDHQQRGSRGGRHQQEQNNHVHRQHNSNINNNSSAPGTPPSASQLTVHAPAWRPSNHSSSSNNEGHSGTESSGYYHHHHGYHGDHHYLHPISDHGGSEGGYHNSFVSHGDGSDTMTTMMRTMSGGNSSTSSHYHGHHAEEHQVYYGHHGVPVDYYGNSLEYMYHPQPQQHHQNLNQRSSYIKRRNSNNQVAKRRSNASTKSEGSGDAAPAPGMKRHVSNSTIASEVNGKHDGQQPHHAQTSRQGHQLAQGANLDHGVGTTLPPDVVIPVPPHGPPPNPNGDGVAVMQHGINQQYQPVRQYPNHYNKNKKKNGNWNKNKKNRNKSPNQNAAVGESQAGGSNEGQSILPPRHPGITLDDGEFPALTTSKSDGSNNSNKNSGGSRGKNKKKQHHQHNQNQAKASSSKQQPYVAALMQQPATPKRANSTASGATEAEGDNKTEEGPGNSSLTENDRNIAGVAEEMRDKLQVSNRSW